MSPYNSQTPAEEVARDCRDAIANKTVLVTGVSPGGLGAEFAKVIAVHRPSLIILASRDQLKAQQTANEIAGIAPEVPTRLLKLDLASQVQVRNAAKEVLAYDEHIDVLVNNAGVMASPFALSEDSVESQFATNHVGHFLFTNLIMSKMVGSGKPSRVVNVSSNGHLLGPVRFHDWNFDVSTTTLVSSGVELIVRPRTARTMTLGWPTDRQSQPTCSSPSRWHKGSAARDLPRSACILELFRRIWRGGRGTKCSSHWVRSNFHPQLLVMLADMISS